MSDPNTTPDPSNVPDPPLIPPTATQAGHRQAGGAYGGSTGPGSPTPAASPIDAQTLANGKLFAILSYAINILGFPFGAVPMYMRDNEFALFHGKQALGLWLMTVILGVIGVVAFMVLAFIFAPLGCIAWIVMVGLLIASVVLNIIGIFNAIGDKLTPLPIVGEMIDGWFRSITLKPR
jgi:uncharacterized membrane protein